MSINHDGEIELQYDDTDLIDLFLFALEFRPSCFQ